MSSKEPYTISKRTFDRYNQVLGGDAEIRGDSIFSELMSEDEAKNLEFALYDAFNPSVGRYEVYQSNSSPGLFRVQIIQPKEHEASHIKLNNLLENNQLKFQIKNLDKELSELGDYPKLQIMYREYIDVLRELPEKRDRARDVAHSAKKEFDRLKNTPLEDRDPTTLLEICDEYLEDFERGLINLSGSKNQKLFNRVYSRIEREPYRVASKRQDEFIEKQKSSLGIEALKSELACYKKGSDLHDICLNAYFELGNVNDNDDLSFVEKLQRSKEIRDNYQENLHEHEEKFKKQIEGIIAVFQKAEADSKQSPENKELAKETKDELEELLTSDSNLGERKKTFNKLIIQFKTKKKALDTEKASAKKAPAERAKPAATTKSAPKAPSSRLTNMVEKNKADEAANTKSTKVEKENESPTLEDDTPKTSPRLGRYFCNA